MTTCNLQTAGCGERARLQGAYLESIPFGKLRSR
jgi:hypothetical protein